jgi:hypothetical protein
MPLPRDPGGQFRGLGLRHDQHPAAEFADLREDLSHLDQVLQAGQSGEVPQEDQQQRAVGEVAQTGSGAVGPQHGEVGGGVADVR